MHNFTQEDLLLYMYNETSSEKTAQIKAALETDWNLKEQYDNLISAQQKLEAFKLSPSSKTIDNILSYAEKSVTELSEQH